MNTNYFVFKTHRFGIVCRPVDYTFLIRKSIILISINDYERISCSRSMLFQLLTLRDPKHSPCELDDPSSHRALLPPPLISDTEKTGKGFQL